MAHSSLGTPHVYSELDQDQQTEDFYADADAGVCMIRSISWQEMMRKFYRLGYRGPYSKGKHLVVVRGDDMIHVPNPHRGDLSKQLIAEMLRRAGISRDDWNNAR